MAKIGQIRYKYVNMFIGRINENATKVSLYIC